MTEAVVHGPTRRVTWRHEHDRSMINRPRLGGYIDVWRGGSLVEGGFEFGTGSIDPVFAVSLQFEAAPGSLLDRLLCLASGVRR